MIVYLDSVWVLNFLVDLLLLYATGRLGCGALFLKRLLLSSGLGAFYAVGVYLPGLSFLSLFPCKLLCAAVMLGLSFGFRRSTLPLAGIFGGLSLVLCGAVYGTQMLGGATLRRSAEGLFFPVSFFALLLTAAAVALAARLLLPRLEHGADSIFPLRLCLKGRSVCLSALRDSGNTLRDPVSGARVLTVYWKAAAGLLPPELRPKQQDFDTPDALALRLKHYAPRLIPYRAVGISGGLLLALPCEIIINKEQHTGLVAFSPTPVSDGGAYDALSGG